MLPQRYEQNHPSLSVVDLPALLGRGIQGCEKKKILNIQMSSKGKEFDFDHIQISPSSLLVGNTVAPPTATRVGHRQGGGGEKAGERGWKETRAWEEIGTSMEAWEEIGTSMESARRQPCQA